MNIYKFFIYFATLLFFGCGLSEDIVTFESLHKERNLSTDLTVEKIAVSTNGDHNFALLRKDKTDLQNQREIYSLIKIAPDNKVNTYEILGLDMTMKDKLGDLFVDDNGGVFISIFSGDKINFIVVDKNLTKQKLLTIQRKSKIAGLFHKQEKIYVFESTLDGLELYIYSSIDNLNDDIKAIKINSMIDVHDMVVTEKELYIIGSFASDTSVSLLKIDIKLAVEGEHNRLHFESISANSNYSLFYSDKNKALHFIKWKVMRTGYSVFKVNSKFNKINASLNSNGRLRSSDVGGKDFLSMYEIKIESESYNVYSQQLGAEKKSINFLKNKKVYYRKIYRLKNNKSKLILVVYAEPDARTTYDTWEIFKTD